VPAGVPLQCLYVPLMMIAGLNVVLVIEWLQVAEHEVHVEENEGDERPQSQTVQLLLQDLLLQDLDALSDEGLRWDQRF
jgi:hypothetical protein